MLIEADFSSPRFLPVSVTSIYLKRSFTSSQSIYSLKHTKFMDFKILFINAMPFSSWFQLYILHIVFISASCDVYIILSYYKNGYLYFKQVSDECLLQSLWRYFRIKKTLLFVQYINLYLYPIFWQERRLKGYYPMKLRYICVNVYMVFPESPEPQLTFWFSIDST